MCELTISASAAGAATHSRRGERACGECRSAENEYRRLIYQPDLHRQQTLWKHYRLRRQDYDGILARQCGLCAICQAELRHDCTTHVDHDHRCDHPGKGEFSCAECVRGILCNQCNWLLRLLDDPQLLARAVSYLGRADVLEVLREGRLF